MKSLAPLVFAVAALLAAPSGGLAGVPDHPAVRVGPPGDWVVLHEPAPEALVDHPKDPPALHYLALDYQIRVDGPHTEEFFSSTYRVENRSGIESASQHEISFDPSFSKIVVHRLAIFRDGRWHDRIEDAFVTIAQRESDFAWRLFDGSLSVLSVIEDIRVGDVVTIAFTQIGTNPVFGSRYFQEIAMGWTAPVEWRRVRALVPRGETLQSLAIGDAVPQPTIRDIGEWTEYLWLLEDLPKVEVDTDLPEDWEPYPWLQLTQYETWAEVADWAVGLYSMPDSESRVVAELATTIAGDDDLDRALAIVRWVQDDIRYFGIELGTFSHEPHAPDETARRRYGDCKDKSLLLIALLREIGVAAWPVLVDSGSGVFLPDRLPSPGLFNHVIVLARIDDHDVWIDPTISMQGGALDALWVPDYGWGLVVRPGENGLTAIPEDPSHPGSIDADYDYVFSDDGSSCEATITTTYSGHEAEVMRYRLANGSAEDLLDSYVQYYSSSNSQVIPIADLGIDDSRGANRLTIVERYALQNWWYRDGNREYFDLLPLMLMTVLETCDVPDRQAPLDLPRRVIRNEKINITTPPGWDLEPVHASARHPWFRYQVDGSRSNERLTLDYQLETFTHPVAPAKVSIYNAAVDQMYVDLDYTIFRSLESGETTGTGPPMTMPPVPIMMIAVWCVAVVGITGSLWLLARLRFL